jgi:hypothetical protein
MPNSINPLEWPSVMNRSAMAHFAMLSDVSVNLVVHRWLHRFLLNGAEDTPSTLNKPGDAKS